MIFSSGRSRKHTTFKTKSKKLYCHVCHNTSKAILNVHLRVTWMT